LPISVAYLGEMLTHPGGVVGTEYCVLCSRRGSLFVTANAGAYVHPKNHVGAFVSSELGYRLTFSRGAFVEALAGVGYLHTFVDGDLYVAGDDGAVQRTRDRGRPAFMPTASIGVGWNAARVDGPPLTPFVRATFFGQYPYNERLLPHAALQVGIRLK
jgi:hypothetical protein